MKKPGAQAANLISTPLAAAGADVTLAVRDVDAGFRIAEQIRTTTGGRKLRSAN